MNSPARAAPTPSFPSSAWERQGAKLRFAALPHSRAACEAELRRQCVPKQSLGTRMVAIAVAALLSHPAADAASPPRPNIVVYLSDDHGQEFAGCYGNAAIRTPNIDALARQGTR